LRQRPDVNRVGPDVRRTALSPTTAALEDASDQPSSATRADGPARRWLERARRLEAAGDIDGAVVAYGRVSRLLPRNPNPCMRAVRLLLRGEDPKRLRFYAACARKRAPSRPMPWAYEGVALQLLGDQAGARRAYLEFHRRAPQHPASWQALEVARRLELGRVDD
jgi:tetratricopeptide (TPR) repeat protein